MIISIIITLQFWGICENWKQEREAQDFLSENYKVFSIGYNRDLIDENNLECSDLIDKILMRENNFMLQKETNNGFKWICYYNYNFEIDVISGRDFMKEDFDRERNVALVSEDLKEDLVKRDGILWFETNNMQFQVVGIFKPIENEVNPNAKVYLSLCSENYKNKGNVIDGKYNLDAGKNTGQIVDEIDNWCSVIKGKTIYERNLKERIWVVLQTQKVPVVIIFFLILVIILSLVCMTSIWIMDRKKEIYVRRLCGATNMQIVFMLLKDYLKIVSIANLIVGIILVLIKQSISIVCMAYTVCLLIGVINCIFIVGQYSTLKIIDLRGK